MKTVEYQISGIEDDAHLRDLEAAVLGLSGVAAIHSGDSNRSVVIEYDPAYLDERALPGFLKSAGYPRKQAKKT